MQIDSAMAVDQITEVALLIKLWPILFGAGLFVIWFVRLEAKVSYMKEDLEKHKEDIWKKMDEVQGSLTTLLKVLYRLEGKIDSRNKDH